MRTSIRTGLIALVALVAAALLAASARAAAPVNTSPPTITGTQQQGKTLTAHNGTWSNSPTSFFYRWQRCDADGTGCVTIDGAVKKTYVLTASDVDHSVRAVVTASNADGETSANSKATDVISSNSPPRNTAPPTVSGIPQPGEELTAGKGTWTGGARTFAYQWQRCDGSGGGCTDVTGANGTTYGVRAADVAHTLRVAVTATNLAGSTTERSATTAVVKTAPAPGPAPTAVNQRPTIRILSIRFVGARVYARLRVCDDSRKNVNIVERDSKRGVASYTRRFRTLAAPRPCSALTRSWLPAPRFRHGPFKVTLWARDFSGLTSRPSARSFFR
jgi:hypothetical protein